MKTRKEEFKIDKEFKEYIFKLSLEEFELLEKSLVKEGCRDALVIWQEENILLDGHNRYEICKKHNITYKTVSISLVDRIAAFNWIDNTQLGRRNLSPDQLRLLRGRLYNRIKKEVGRPQKELAHFGPILSTAQKIAKASGVSKNTMKRDAMFAKKVDESPELLKAILDKIPVSQIIKEKQIKEIHEKITRETKDALTTTATVEVCDCLKWLEKQPECDLLITDPPYSTDVKDIEKFASWITPALEKVKETGRAYVFIGAYPQEVKTYLSQELPVHMKLEQILIWSFKNTLGNNPLDRYKLNYQMCLYFKGSKAPVFNCPSTAEQWAAVEMNAPDGRLGDRYHTWQKPIELAERFIRHSTKQKDVVYDPFTCTGTFLLAAAKLGRIAKGCDISEDNLKIAIERGCVYA